MEHPRIKSRAVLALRMVGATALLAAILACGAGSDDSTPSSASPTATPAAPSGPTALAITPLNLHIMAPAGATVSEMLGMQMVQGSGLAVNVKAATDMDPADIAAARHEAELFSPTNLVEETLPDGYVLTYQNTGGLGTNYFVTVRRTIDNTAYMCSTMAADAEQQRAAVEACKSLRR